MHSNSQQREEELLAARDGTVRRQQSRVLRAKAKKKQTFIQNKFLTVNLGFSENQPIIAFAIPDLIRLKMELVDY